MKNLILPSVHRIFLITGTLALLASQAKAVSYPQITSPVDGAAFVQSAVDIQVSVAGISDVQSVKIRSNGTDIGTAEPSSLFGEWTFPDGSHISVMEDSSTGEVMIDYSPPNEAPMYLMDGSFTDADTFTGTFTHWAGGNADPINGNVTMTFAFDAGLLNIAIAGDSPLGNRGINGGLSQNEDYHFVWKNPPAGSQVLTAVVTYLISNAPAEITSSEVTINIEIPKAPEIVVEQPKGSGLTDGAAKTSFGTAKIGTAAATKTFTIRNTGTTALTGLAIKKNGSNPKDFIVTALEKVSLPAGASTTFKVTFKPRGKVRGKGKAKSNRNANIHITSNDSDENPFDIKLTGLGKKR